jgi:predicted Zn-dependent protease
MFDAKLALNDLPLPADAWVGIRELRQSSITRQIRDGRPALNHHYFTHGAMIEVLVDGQFAQSATCHLDRTSLHLAAWLAFARASTMAGRGVHKFTTAQRPPSVGKFKSTIKEQISSKSAPDLVDLLVRVGARLKVNPKIVSTDVMYRFDDVETRFVSRNGADIEQKFYLSALNFSATAEESGQSQIRSANGFLSRCYQKGLEVLDTATLFPEAIKTGEQALELLSAPNCPSDTRSLVLMPDQMYMQIHESVGHPLELDRILGDEFNYAGHSFLKLDDFGKLQYGSDLLNVVYDPTVVGEYASFAFDDVGAPASRQFLIEKGVLKRPLGGLESQARANLDGVANTRTIYWNRAPIDRMGNINIEAGTQSFEDVIAGVEKGILMESNRSWSIDDRRENFQFGCEYGRLIENGQIKGVVKNPGYRGTTLNFWRNLKALGNASTWKMYGSPFCGKGEPNQVVRVGHGAPVAHFENVEIFGGGQ